MTLEPQKIRRILSENLKFRRKIMGISQEKLAEMAELSAQTINDIEGCRMWVSDKTIAKLCGALHIEAYQLLLPYQNSSNKTSDLLGALIVLQQNIEKSISTQFEELFKSGLLP
jgi:transcriptional regulator with XRE-family HTH domain